MKRAAAVRGTEEQIQRWKDAAHDSRLSFEEWARRLLDAAAAIGPRAGVVLMRLPGETPEQARSGGPLPAAETTVVYDEEA